MTHSSIDCNNLTHVADVVFGMVPDQTKFYLFAAFSLLGLLVTLVFLPDTTGLDLSELDRLHKHVLTGQMEQYTGGWGGWGDLCCDGMGAGSQYEL